MFNWIKNWLKRRTAKRKSIGTPIDCSSIPHTKEVWMGRKNGHLVMVESLPVGRYLDIIPKLDRIPAVLIKSAQYKSAPIEFLTAAIDVVKDEFIDIIEGASGLDRDFIVNEVSLPEMVRFLIALHEVNEFYFIVGELKKRLGGMLQEAILMISQDNGNG